MKFKCSSYSTTDISSSEYTIYYCIVTLYTLHNIIKPQSMPSENDHRQNRTPSKTTSFHSTPAVWNVSRRVPFLQSIWYWRLIFGLYGWTLGWLRGKKEKRQQILCLQRNLNAVFLGPLNTEMSLCVPVSRCQPLRRKCQRMVVNYWRGCALIPLLSQQAKCSHLSMDGWNKYTVTRRLVFPGLEKCQVPLRIQP